MHRCCSYLGVPWSSPQKLLHSLRVSDTARRTTWLEYTDAVALVLLSFGRARTSSRLFLLMHSMITRHRHASTRHRHLPAPQRKREARCIVYLRSQSSVLRAECRGSCRWCSATQSCWRWFTRAAQQPYSLQPWQAPLLCPLARCASCCSRLTTRCTRLRALCQARGRRGRRHHAVAQRGLQPRQVPGGFRDIVSHTVHEGQNGHRPCSAHLQASFDG